MYHRYRFEICLTMHTKGLQKEVQAIFGLKILIQAVQARERARKRAERSPTVPNKKAYNRTFAEIKRLINSSKRETFQNTCNSLDLVKEGDKAWSLINNFNGEDRTRNPKPLKTPEVEIAEEQKSPIPITNSLPTSPNQIK